MKKGQSKSKGTQYERDICKKLSLWWTNGKRNDIFWTTSGSGSRATRATKMKAKQFGDVCAIDPKGDHLIDLFTIELKRGYNNKTPFDILDSRDKTWLSWFEDIQRDHERAGSLAWWIISKRDRRKELVTIPEHLDLQIASIQNLQTIRTHVPELERDVYTYRLDEFLETLTPKRVMAIQ